MGEGTGCWHDEGFGEEIVVEIISRCRLLQGLPVRQGRERLDPCQGFDALGCRDRECAQEFGLYAVAEGVEGAKVSPGDGKALAIEVDAETELAVDDGGVAGKVLDVEEMGCRFGGGLEHIGDGEGVLDDGGGGGLGLHVEGRDDAEGVCSASECLVKVSSAK